MKIKVWGSRGSICAPGVKTLRYGGNTTCVELRTSTGQVIIVDAGSGLRNLGRALLEEKQTTRLTLVFTHYHWDHLMGFPFFRPAYLPDFDITLCGAPLPRSTVKNCLTQQMTAPYFPVDFGLMKAKFTFAGPRPGDIDGEWFETTMGLPGSQVIPLNHPNGGYGLKFADGAKTFALLTDNELGWPHEHGLSFDQYVQFCRGVDVLFHDAQYTDLEYRYARSWGHSCYSDTIRLAIAAGVKQVGLFHHDPDRADDELDSQVEACRAQIKEAGSQVECFAVAEGMELDL